MSTSVQHDESEYWHPSGFGLWLVNQLCDLVQLRTFPWGSVVRLGMALG